MHEEVEVAKSSLSSRAQTKAKVLQESVTSFPVRADS